MRPDFLGEISAISWTSGALLLACLSRRLKYSLLVHGIGGRDYCRMIRAAYYLKNDANLVFVGCLYKTKSIDKRYENERY